jgi:hypothetical protein
VYNWTTGCAMVDLMSAVRQRKRRWEFDKDIHLDFIDNEEAYYKINRQKIWKALHTGHISKGLMDRIRNIITNVKTMKCFISVSFSIVMDEVIRITGQDCEYQKPWFMKMTLLGTQCKYFRSKFS